MSSPIHSSEIEEGGEENVGEFVCGCGAGTDFLGVRPVCARNPLGCRIYIPSDADEIPEWVEYLRERFLSDEEAEQSRFSTFLFQITAAAWMMLPVAVACLSVGVVAWVLDLDPAGSPPWVGWLPFPDVERTEGLSHVVFVGQTLANVCAVMAAVVVMTYWFALLYYLRARRVMIWMLVVAHFVFLFGFPLYLLAYADSWLARWMSSFRLDWVTVVLICWNIALCGVTAVFMEEANDMHIDPRTRRRHRQAGNAILLLDTVALSWPFLCFPEWTVWSIVIALILWDLFAVLAPCGPLGYIMRHETSGTGIRLPPSLMYEMDRYRLGTGDLLFFAVLVGRGAVQGWLPFIATFSAVLFGIASTVYATFVAGRVIPALPIALVLGILAYVTATFTASPYAHAHPYVAY